LGQETTLEVYLARLLLVTSELYRVLKPTGTLFWNHGDCYGGSGGDSGKAHNRERGGPTGIDTRPVGIGGFGAPPNSKITPQCLAFQNCRLILKMIDEQGWILRNTLIWKKPNPMPFSGTSRYTNTYEPIYFFVKSNTPQYHYNERTKLITRIKPKGNVEGTDWEWITCPYCEGTGKSSFNIGRWDERREDIYGEDAENRSRVRKGLDNADKRYKAGDKPCYRCKGTGRIKRSFWHSDSYFFDLNSIRRPHKDTSLERMKHGWDGHREPGSSWEGMDIKKMCHPLGANPGDIMEVPTKGFKGSHYATFPINLISPLILAGSPAKICVYCGLPKVQIVESSHPGGTQFQGKYSGQKDTQGGLTTKGSFGRVIGDSHCSCEPQEYERGVVLDPFSGSGTTALAAKKLGRSYIGIDISGEYVEMSRSRLSNIEESLPFGEENYYGNHSEKVRV